MKHLITGIQQAGIGVSDCTSAISYYKELFGMNILIFDDTANADLMTSYTGDKVYRRRAVLTMNLSGGGGFELWQFLSRKPESCRPEYGDYGIFSITLKCQEIQSAYESFKTKKDIILSALKKNPAGEYHFCIEDIYQNSFNIVEGKEWFKTDGKSVGGVIGGVIGVADMDASVKFYGDFLGIKDVVYDVTGHFEDIPRSSEHEFRRVLLRKAKSPCGAFTNLLGEVEIELVQRIQHRSKKIFENRYWGDCGFIHLCFDVTDMDTLKELSVSKGYDFTVDSQNSFSMDTAMGRFCYVEDPDGTLIELVETHKIPIVKKWNWHVDLRKRKNQKPLPSWMISLLGLNKVK